MQLEFEWDDRKAHENVRRHGVDFVDATGVFFDPRGVEVLDDRVHYGEDRFRLIGVAQGRLLLVVYTERKGRTRIISARAANRKERTAYENAYRR
jgi:uncharacterized DUF497 family protein